MTQLSVGYERGFRILFSLSIFILISFMILCGYSLGLGEDLLDESILGNFNAVAAAIMIIGFPLLFIIFTYVYLQAYRR